jgi:hypothetical protein
MKKTFNNSKLKKQEFRKAVCAFAKEQGIKTITFSNRAKFVRGTYNAFTNSLFLDLKQTRKEMLHTFFHELGHHLAVKKDLWKDYHYCTIPEMTCDDVFMIENSIDHIAGELWIQHVDIKQWGKYKYAYPKSQKSNIIQNFISKQ